MGLSINKLLLKGTRHSSRCNPARAAVHGDEFKNDHECVKLAIDRHKGADPDICVFFKNALQR